MSKESAVYDKRIDIRASEYDQELLNQLIDDTGTNRSEILRKGLRLVWNIVVSEKEKLDREIRADLDKGRLPSISDLVRKRRDLLRKEIDKMVYKECLDTSRKGCKSDA